ncbi:hypothetical protein SAMN04489716_1624 [Actinoplanes derwentensis]|uniref:Phage major capsid protein, HK97 family n=2 Tax=Actinoplanes derwentensis TaxID=113562 RepID=A0A1H1V3X6_9ACTN|nr:hypothetical protein Ade03nite_94410 [Actinoplanes derwentensis]SDS79086.1 hypothetical protein SAMN04489716_1624 [Actinoplanes derwentensis]
MSEEILAALAGLSEKLDRPTVTPVPVATVTKEEPLYDLNGGSARFNFSEDVVASFKGDAAAHQRVDGFINETFSVSSADVTPGKAPGWRPEVGYSNLRPYGRVLDRVITRGSLSDNQPFAYPILNGVTGTLVAPHVEGVEPVVAGGATWGTQTVIPSALSGKVGFNRETIDLIGGMAQSLLFAEMTKASEKAAELRLVALLDGLSLPAGQIKTVNGSNDVLMDNLDAMHLGLLEPQRFDGAVASPALYSKLFLAKDSTGRRLNSALNPSNANGRADGLSAISANGLTFIQGRDTLGNGTVNSYLIDSSCVYQWLSAPKRLDFDIAVAVVYMGFWQYSAEAVTDKSGIIRINTGA